MRVYSAEVWVYSAVIWVGKEMGVYSAEVGLQRSFLRQEVWVYITEVCLQCSFLGERELRAYSAAFWIEQKLCVNSAEEWVSSVNLKRWVCTAHEQNILYLLAAVKLLCLDTHTWTI